MKNHKQVNDSVQRRINEAALVQQIKDHEGYKLVIEQLKPIRDSKDLSLAESWEDFLQKKAYLDGLEAFNLVMDKILAKAKTAERTLTSK
jgi:hypothetical protein